MAIMFRDILEEIAYQSGVVFFEKYDSTIAVTTLNDPGSVSRNIANSDIYTDENRNAIFDFGQTESDNLITSMELFYKPIAPLDSGWGGRIYCKRTGVSDNGNMPDKYKGWLQEAYETLGKENPLTLYCPGIRDEDTAIALTELVLKWRVKSLYTMRIECALSVLDIEYGDNIGVTADIVPSHLQDKRWKVFGINLHPGIGKQKNSVVLDLIEIGGSNLEAVTEWTDVLTGGTSKTDVLSGGTKYQEVIENG